MFCVDFIFIISFITRKDLPKTWEPGTWNESAAQKFCEDYISLSDNPIIQQCPDKLDKVEDAIWNCMEDIQVTDLA